ncbi:MAG: LysM peptidoglycan-binding domain-containing protein [Candidatus Riflebacteria bacterium]|nr:LysM peptidoglycan-binding domain-containing protein [Candidatus Riflebacteria bacterium]
MNRRSFARAGLLLLVGLLVLVTGVTAEQYTMREGDTLWEIARTRYGDPSFYRDLQQVNSIGDPRQIPNGTVITLPSKATLQKLRQTTDPAERARILRNEGAQTNPQQPTGPTPFNPVQGLGARQEVPRTGAGGN